MSNNRGSTLATVVMISSILLIFAVAFSTSVVADVTQSARQQRNVEAHYIAMAGANATCEKIVSMNETQRKDFANLEFPIESDETPFAEGSFTVTIDENPSQLIIESVGKVQSGKDGYVEATVVRILEKKVLLPASGNAPFAIYAKGQIVTEEYPGVDGTIAISSGKSGTIDFKSHADLKDGDGKSIIYIPKGSDPEELINKPDWWKISDHAEITDITPEGFPDDIADLKDMYPEPKLPVFPTNLPNKGSIELSGPSGVETISGDGYYEKLSVTHSKKLIIDTKGAPVTQIRVNEFSLNGGDRRPVLEIVGDGKVYIYADNVKAFNGSVKTPDPGNVIFYLNSSPVNLGGDIRVGASLYFGDTNVKIGESCQIDGDIVVSRHGSVNIVGGSNINFGVIYAPNANITVGGGGKILGAIIGNDVTMSGGTKLTYDGSGRIKVPIETSEKGKVIYKKGYWK